MSSIALADERDAWVRCDLQVVALGRGASVETLNWEHLQSVSIEAQVQGDERSLCWRLQGLGVRRCLIPFGLPGEVDLLQHLQRLDGFDVLAVADALCGSAAGRFICWRRERTA